MRSRLLTTISAVALIAGAGLAHAQDKGGPAAAPQTTSPAQQSAPPSSQPGGAKGGSELQQRQEAPPVRAEKGSDRNKNAEQTQERGDKKQRAQEQSPKREKSAEEKRDRLDKNAQDKSDRKSGASTTGQGAAGSSASLTTEQRTKISKTIRQSNVKSVTNVNFNISVGTVVPHSVSLHPLPTAVIEVYPQWRGYRFILVEDEIIIIEPSSYRIVAVINA